MFGWLEHPFVKWAVPIPVLIGLAPLVWRMFRETWRELEDDAFVLRQELRAQGKIDFRPAAVCLIGTFVLLVQDIFGRYGFYQAHVLPVLREAARTREGLAFVLGVYDESLGRTWWAAFRIGGYLLPLVLWRFLFPRDSLRDMGLRVRGFREHAWLYALFLVIIIPLMALVAQQPDFGRQYPINGSAGRSWVDFVWWEALYITQFFALEVFFRGWWIRASRSLGIGAIFFMVVPYAMIHISKPYLEACGAIVAGTVLGSLSMRTGSIWAGFLVHATVGLLMDVSALSRKGQLPLLVSGAGDRKVAFLYWDALVWAAWGLAVLVLLWRFRGVVLRRRR